jgi:hypothetical protein
VRSRTASALVLAALLQLAATDELSASSLRFYGHGVSAPDLDRVKIRIDDPVQPADAGPPVDVGATDFTIELWLRATSADNTASAVSCGFDLAWINGNILIDRDRFNQDRKYGVSIAGGEVVFGVSGDGTGDATICSATQVTDDSWHHVALQRRRSDGRMSLYVDGVLEAELDGPDGDCKFGGTAPAGPRYEADTPMTLNGVPTLSPFGLALLAGLIALLSGTRVSRG